MPGFLLDAGATITCPHGGAATVVPRAVKVSLGGKPPLLVDDVATIAGCAFNVSGAPSPCIRIQWTGPATKVSSAGSPLLLSSSVGLCLNAAGAPQGTALVTGFQTKVQGK
jgi:hypothetical protein